MSNQCFVLPAGGLSSARTGTELHLEGPEGHHAVMVKRVRPGEMINLVDGSGVRAVTEVTGTQKAALDGIVRHLDIEQPAAVSITLVQALAKGDRDLQAVESAVELGIDAVRPWQSERSIVRWNEAKAAKALAKWEATVLAALKQSRRTFLPEVRGMLSSTELAGEFARCDCAPGPALVIVLHERGTEPLSATVATWFAGLGPAQGAEHAQRPEIQLVVGPEGGISDSELEKFVEAGAKVALLGHHVLRASTAGPAAVVLTRHLLGQL
ncbi:16S rRNA (uracil(1498)-N(3))-methyltransferase [Paeniglutamicibacter antarcticus]|uniref:Ribosomal RNA small subunit methyltransferase E n=1 Tax=Paeniglutamicibacter antarcticus TaxID=494023 RepID=A0ABP9TJ39_9MICC